MSCHRGKRGSGDFNSDSQLHVPQRTKVTVVAKKKEEEKKDISLSYPHNYFTADLLNPDVDLRDLRFKQ